MRNWFTYRALGGDFIVEQDCRTLNGITVRAIYEGDDETFMSRVLDFARGFVPPAKASKAVGAIKRAVQTGAEIPFETALALERELQQQLFESEDAREGLAANVEKRKPAFKGR